MKAFSATAILVTLEICITALAISNWYFTLKFAELQVARELSGASPTIQIIPRDDKYLWMEPAPATPEFGKAKPDGLQKKM